MAIIRWEPLRLEDLPQVRFPKFGTDMAVDVYEDQKNVYADIQMPGVNPENIDIDVEDDFVRVAGAREEKTEDKDKDYYYQEITRGSFERSFRLPTKVNAKDSTAAFEDGVITITMPKATEQKAQKIKPKRATTSKEQEIKAKAPETKPTAKKPSSSKTKKK